jgi:hypothetical protein
MLYVDAPSYQILNIISTGILYKFAPSPLLTSSMMFRFVPRVQYIIFLYVDPPSYQILKNLNVISTGVLYRYAPSPLPFLSRV